MEVQKFDISSIKEANKLIKKCKNISDISIILGYPDEKILLEELDKLGIEIGFLLFLNEKGKRAYSNKSSKKYIENLSPEKKRLRREKNKEQARKYYKALTPEEKRLRNEKIREHARKIASDAKKYRELTNK